MYTTGYDRLTDSIHEENALKRFKTKSGTLVEFSDENGKEAIWIKTLRKLSIKLKQYDESILISSGDAKLLIDGKSGKVQVIGQKELLLESGSAMLSMKSDGTI